MMKVIVVDSLFAILFCVLIIIVFVLLLTSIKKKIN